VAGRLEVPAGFDFDQLSKTAFNVVWGEPQEVRIRFSREQAPYVQERTYTQARKSKSVPTEA